MAATSDSSVSRPVPSTLTQYKIDETVTTLQVVAAVAAKRHYVWGFFGTLPASNSITFKSDDTAISPAFVSPGLSRMPPSPIPSGAFPICFTAVNEALKVTLGSSGALGMFIWVETAP